MTIEILDDLETNNKYEERIIIILEIFGIVIFLFMNFIAFSILNRINNRISRRILIMFIDLIKLMTIPLIIK